ncbi:hypothetical protein [Spartinivicinus poritis]|uniref:Uncharacterized protein n=1 Tax=Spartinivicinus poritis TaxID=2994640 RepID=A0ABT5UE29_9GAMM|nr:hypothetical protein [Spartinivicinus sp. A2-2]MDE1464636.1 hypothetical protein [Spartinivicinus sp. A2-2]
MKRWFFRLILLVVCLAVAGFFITDATPPFATNQNSTLTIKQLTKANAPVYLANEKLYQVTILPTEATAVLNHGVAKVQRLFPFLTGIKADYLQNKVQLQGVVNVLGRYLTLSFEVEPTPEVPKLTALKVGPIPIPQTVTDWGIGQAQQHPRTQQLLSIYQTIEQVNVSPTQIVVKYQSGKVVSGINQQSRELLFSAEQQQQIGYYLTAIYVFASQQQGVRLPDFWKLFQYLTEQARQQVRQGASAVAQNQAILTALALYQSSFPTGDYLANKALRNERRRIFYVHRRKDLARHFSFSAAIALYAGNEVSDTLGLWKELDDAKNGSGFSFYDLAADRAGIQFAAYATKDEQTAKAVQQKIVNTTADALIPRLSQLPEGMTESQFKRRYQNPDSQGYLQLVKQIDQRIQASQLYQ